MKIINTKIKGLKIIQQTKHGDNRGYLRETFIKKIIKWDELIFDYATTSKKNVLRGFHFQSKPTGRTGNCLLLAHLATELWCFRCSGMYSIYL